MKVFREVSVLAPFFPSQSPKEKMPETFLYRQVQSLIPLGYDLVVLVPRRASFITFSLL